MRKPERAGRGAEPQVAGALALVVRAVRRRGVERRVLEVAGRDRDSPPCRRISEAPRRPGSTESRRSPRGSCAGQFGSPGTQQSGSGMAPQPWKRSRLFLAARIAIPVDRAAEPLRVGIGVEAVVEGGGEEPDLAPGALGGGQSASPAAKPGLRLLWARKRGRQMSSAQSPSAAPATSGTPRSPMGARQKSWQQPPVQVAWPCSDESPSANSIRVTYRHFGRHRSDQSAHKAGEICRSRGRAARCLQTPMESVCPNAGAPRK